VAGRNATATETDGVRALPGHLLSRNGTVLGAAIVTHIQVPLATVVRYVEQASTLQRRDPVRLIVWRIHIKMVSIVTAFTKAVDTLVRLGVGSNVKTNVTNVVNRLAEQHAGTDVTT